MNTDGSKQALFIRAHPRRSAVQYSFLRALANAVSTLLSESRWAGAALARAEVLLTGGGTAEDAAHILYASGCFTLTKARALIPQIKENGFVALIDDRTRMGSAENPVKKSSQQP